MNPLNIIYGVLGLAIVAGVGVYAWKCEDAKQFKDMAVVLADAARDKAIAQMVKDRKLKEKADAELEALRAANTELDKRLRDERARSRAVSKPAARAPSPERACFKGPLFDAAVARLVDELWLSEQRLDEEVSRLTRQCQDAVAGLDSAKRWAQEPR